MKKSLLFCVVATMLTMTIPLTISVAFNYAKAQSNGVVIVSEDNSRGVTCYAKSHSSDNISCVKTR